MARLNREKNSKFNLAVRPEELSDSQILTPTIEIQNNTSSNPGVSISQPNLSDGGGNINRKILVKFDSEIMERTITEDLTEDASEDGDNHSDDSLDKATGDSLEKPDSLLKMVTRIDIMIVSYSTFVPSLDSQNISSQEKQHHFGI